MYIHYSDKRTDIIRNTSFTVEDVFDDKLGKHKTSPDKNKLKFFLAKMM